MMKHFKSLLMARELISTHLSTSINGNKNQSVDDLQYRVFNLLAVLGIKLGHVLVASSKKMLNVRFVIGVTMAVSVAIAHSATIRIPGQLHWVGVYGGRPPGKLYGSADDACASSEVMTWFGIQGRWSFMYSELRYSPPYGTYTAMCHYKDEGGGDRPLYALGQTIVCPSGFSILSGSHSSEACYGYWTIDPKNNGASNPKICNPVNPATGNKYQIESDYIGTGLFPLHFQRTYNAAIQVKSSGLGVNWSTTFGRSIGIYPTYALVYRADGKILHFERTNDVFTAAKDVADKLTILTDASNNKTGYQYVSSQDDTVETYNIAGQLATITARSGLRHTYTYDSQNRLSAVTDHYGRRLVLTYDSAQRITTMTDPLGGLYRYTYDAQGNLATVTYPGGVSRIYHYNEPAHTGGANLPNSLTGITDENGTRYATYRYDSSGKAISTEHAGGADKATLTYGTNSTTVTDPLGTTRTYQFTNILGVLKPTGQDQPAGAGCSPASTAMTYDANGNIASRTDFNGNKTTYTYDLTRNLETSRVEAAGTPQARTITTAWHPTLRLPAKVAEPKRITTFTYDEKGNLLSKTEQATNDATGAQGFSSPVVGTARSWNYTYNAVGQVLTATSPRTAVTDKTTYTYDESGNLATMTNGMGQTTTLTDYDANGRVGKILDPNGIATTLTYTPRGWLSTRIVTAGDNTETTQYAYDGVGQLTSVTLPDNATITYTYDGAHRLTGIADSMGNSIVYTLDAMGNRTKEQVKDPNGTLSRQTSRLYDALNRLQQVTGGVQ